MPNQKKKKNPNDSKKQVCIYIDAELQEFVHEKGLNLSGLVNEALKLVKSNISSQENTNSLNLKLILQKTPNNSAKEWIRGDSNARTSPCEGDVIPLDHESIQKG